jgi:NADPH2:quinone reductase
MRAAYYEANGAARDVLRVGEVETPSPGPGEVRVRIAASGVNPSDVKAREGRTRRIAFPRVIPHSDAARIIDAVGSGVAASRVGERVWTWNGQWKRAFGTAAEYITLPEVLAVPLPEHTSFAEGACLGIPAMTAAHAVAVSGLGPGGTALISGGAGGVGHYAVQFAKAAGASVITTISSEEKAKLARAAGADHVVDYEHENVGERVMALTGGRGVDAVIELDLAANARLLPGVAHAHTKVVIYGTGAMVAEIPAQFLLTSAITLQFVFVYELTPAERIAALAVIARLIEQRQLLHNVAATFALDDIVTAHEAVEQGRAPGNVVVTVA